MPNRSNFPPPSSAIDLPSFEKWLRETPGLYSGPGSTPWRVNGERVLVLGWGRAILLQIAHPLVAEGVAHHSVFSNSFRAKIGRFWRTQERMLRLTFGTPAEVWQSAQFIDQIHHRVHGERVDSRGYTTTSIQYSARDVELLKWVHATFVDSILKTYSLFVKPLSDAEQNDYLFKASIVGPLLGAPCGYFPQTLNDLHTYISETVASGGLQVDDQTLQLARYVLDGVPIPILQQGLSWALTLSTSALLPPSLRDAYGLRLRPYERVLFDAAAWMSRQAHRILPAPLHRWQLACRVEKRTISNE
jgi:uncharacterized protein (DUF2236 family)